MSDHAELAPGGANGSVLHHDAVIWFGFSGIGVLIRVIMQGLLLVVLVQLLLWNRRAERKVLFERDREPQRTDVE